MSQLPTVLMMDTTSDAITAVKKPLTANPSKKEAANQNKAPLMTKMNNPRVRILIGNVKMMMIGLTSTLSPPKMSAAISAG